MSVTIDASANKASPVGTDKLPLGDGSHLPKHMTLSQVNTYVGANVTIAKGQAGLGNVDNTSDANKPVSTAQATADALKADKTTTVNGHALSANVVVTAADVGSPSGSGTSSGSNTGDQTITLTGNVTGSGTGSFATTIANSAVTLAKMADVATASVFYRKTAGTGAPEVNTLATLKTDLGLTGTNSGDQTSVSGNSGTATALQTSRNINGTAFNGTADITVAADAGTLTGATLAAGVTASSLTSVGTITTGTWHGGVLTVVYGGTGLSSVTKGDLLLGSGTNTLAALAVGSDGSIIVADANSATGWIIAENTLRPNIQSGRILTPLIYNTISTTTLSTSTLYAVAVYVKKRSTFSGIAFGVNTASGVNLHVKIGIYTDSNGLPGSLVSNSTATSAAFNDVADASHTVSFAAGNLTLNPGWYWLAIQTDQNQSVKGISNSGLQSSYGALDMLTGGPKFTVLNTYSSGMPSTFGTPTITEAGVNAYIGLLVV